MEKTHVNLDPAYPMAEGDPRIFGGFLEHMGRAVYQGVFDPDSAQADEHGFRKDVMGTLRQLRMTTKRYPGGNFASGYHWMGSGQSNSVPRCASSPGRALNPTSSGPMNL